MTVSYRNRLIEFNRRKHKLILQKAKFFKVAKHYFVEEDYEAIKNMSPTIAKVIWKQLVHNIELIGHWGISQHTCTFCINRELFGMKCSSCEWAKNHKLCIDKTGDFSQLQIFFEKKHIKTITHEEYINIIDEVRSIIK